MTALLAYWLHDLSPFLLKFNEQFGIRYYGLAYLAGFGLGWYLLCLYGRRGLTQLNAEQVGDLMTGLVFGVLVGGRVGYYVFYQPGILWRDPLSLLRVWEGGMASHGGFIGVILTLIWYAGKFRLPWRHVGDLVASVTGAGILFGRLANFINGELWGKVTTVPWAVIFPASAAPDTPLELIAPRHPSQLYGAALEGLLLFALTQWLVWKTPLLRRAPGRIGGVFLLGYAVMRVGCELFREPDAGVAPILGLSRGTFYSLFLAVAGVVLLLVPTRSLLAASGPKSASQAKEH
jgi:phosphatidylglycerol---prolipoprotein diacylglyceryl transferase